MWVRKDKAGACSGPDGGYTWENDGDVIEVPDHIGEELVGIRGGGFAEVDAPKRAAQKDTATQGSGQSSDSGQDGGQDDGSGSSGDGEGDSSGEASKPSARRGRPRKTVEE